MEQTVFRKKSLERISTLEQSDSCIRIAGPGLWLTVLAVGLLVIALLIWGIVVQSELQTNVKDDAAQKVSVVVESTGR